MHSATFIQEVKVNILKGGAALVFWMLCSSAYAEVRIIVGSAAGGANDIYARVLAQHLTQRIGPIVVQNMAGAGGRIPAEYCAHQAGKSDLCFLLPESITAALYDPQLRYDPRALKPLGSLNRGEQLCFSPPGSRIKSYRDMWTGPFASGAQQGGTTFTLAHVVRNAGLLHPGGPRVPKEHFKVVTGYPGTAAMYAALERGEIDVMCGVDIGSIRVSRPAWLVENTKANIIVVMGPEKSSAPLPSSAVDLWDVVASDDRDALRLVLATQLFLRPVFGSLAMADDDAKKYAAAIESIAAGEAFQASARKAGLDIRMVPATVVEKSIRSIFATSPAVIDRARRLQEPM